MNNKQIEEIFEDVFFEDNYTKTSRLHFPEFTTDELEILHVILFGGMNGWGDSKDYLRDIADLIDSLEKNNIYAYVTNMTIDALDDVFKVELELRDLEEFNKEKSE